MPIQLAGTLPVSAVNTGLSASLSGLTAEVTNIQADLAGLTTALTSQLQLSARFPPNPVTYGAAILGLNALKMTAAMGAMGTYGGAINVELAAKLGSVNGQLAIVRSLSATLDLGLEASGLSAWSYAGRAGSFGERLEQATRNGFGKTPAGAQVSARIIATESLASWGSLSQSVNTGGTAASPAAANDARLTYLGELGGSDMNLGVLEVSGRLNAILADLEGQAGALEQQVSVSLGADLPDVTALVDAGLEVVGELGVDGLLDNLVNAQVDLSAEISGVGAKLAAKLGFIASLNAQLSAGGLAVWLYQGTASGLGEALRGELAQGIPDGNGANAVAYGLVIAGAADSMGSFSRIFI